MNLYLATIKLIRVRRWTEKLNFDRRILARQMRTWFPSMFWILLFGYAVWPWMPWQARPPVTVTFYGFSILEESMNGTVFPAFQDTWREASGEHVEFISSFAGSGTVTNQLIMGVPAQLALLSLELDAQRLADKGLVSRESWESLPHGGIVNRTPMVILVRKGNPKNIRDFSDLARPGIRIVHPDPLTSGGAAWAILAEYGAGMRMHPDRPHQAGLETLKGIWRNVVAQAHSARAARMQFENGFGDALITYEQELLWDRMHGRLDFEIVYPHSTILTEHVLVVVRRNIQPDQRNIVNAFVDFLWSDRAQTLFTRTGFRSVNDRINESNPVFGQIADPFTVADLGGWEKAKREIVDHVWKEQVLKELGRGR
ncbi:MAG: solute-binding protein [Acidobacteria bacterium]|nr:solute-binding protein [Acidobacteriota bacterium]